MNAAWWMSGDRLTVSNNQNNSLAVRLRSWPDRWDTADDRRLKMYVYDRITKDKVDNGSSDDQSNSPQGPHGVSAVWRYIRPASGSAINTTEVPAFWS